MTYDKLLLYSKAGNYLQESMSGNPIVTLALGLQSYEQWDYTRCGAALYFALLGRGQLQTPDGDNVP